MTDKKSMWNEAGKAGLVLGVVSIAYMAYTLLTQNLKSESAAGALGISILNLTVWAAKFVACIVLFKTFVRKYSLSGSGITNADTFRFGAVVALGSALIYSGAFLAYYSLINPEAMESVWEMAETAYRAQMDSNALSVLDNLHENILNITFFANLGWCFLFGLVLSAIFSRRYPSQNPFDAD